MIPSLALYIRLSTSQPVSLVHPTANSEQKETVVSSGDDLSASCTVPIPHGAWAPTPAKRMSVRSRKPPPRFGAGD